MVISFTDAEKKNIEDFYEHRKLVLEHIKKAILLEKGKKS